MKILMNVIVAIVDCNMEITIKDAEEYAKYYYSVKTLLKQKPLTFKEWQQRQLVN
jgi:N-acetyl-gamma-glutamylphosphate reductase